MAKTRGKKSKVSRSKSKVTRKSVKKPAKKLKRMTKSKMKKSAKKRYMRQEEPGRGPIRMKSKPEAERIAAEIAKNYPKTESAIMNIAEGIRHPIKTTVNVSKAAVEKVGEWQAKRAIEAQKSVIEAKKKEEEAATSQPASAQTTSYTVPVRQGIYGRAIELPKELGEFKVTENRLDPAETFDDAIKREVKARNPALFENADLEVRFEGKNVSLKIVPKYG